MSNKLQLQNKCNKNVKENVKAFKDFQSTLKMTFIFQGPSITTYTTSHIDALDIFM